MILLLITKFATNYTSSLKSSNEVCDTRDSGLRTKTALSDENKINIYVAYSTYEEYSKQCNYIHISATAH